MGDGDSLAVSDNTTGSIYRYSLLSRDLVLNCGSGVKQASDGLETSFVQPSALCMTFSQSIIVCDAAIGQVKMVSLSNVGLISYIEALYLLNNTFGVLLKHKHLNRFFTG